MKLGVVIMGQNCEKLIDMALESVKDADWIVYCDGGSIDGTIEYLNKKEFYGADTATKRRIIYQEYNQEDKGMNGKQRNFYLKYVAEHHAGDWCLAIDADEIVEDFNALKKFVQSADKEVYHVKMRHLIGDLAHEDATQQIHWVMNRLFKIQDGLFYPEIEHPVLNSLKEVKHGLTNATTIWHLAYIPNMWEIKKRYENHMKKSNMHTPQFLKWWYFNHLFGTYPRTQFNPVELPKILLDKFGIEKDELYFSNRQLELKHFIEAIQWRDYFKLEGKLILDVGCGLGPRVLAMNNIGLMCDGIEISKWAVDHSLIKNVITQGDITKETYANKYALVIAYDVLEHIDHEDIEKAVKNVIAASEDKILVSVPFSSDPNAHNDSTHKIIEDKEWWVNAFTQNGCKLIETPDHFIYKDQILIFEVKHGTN